MNDVTPKRDKDWRYVPQKWQLSCSRWKLIVEAEKYQYHATNELQSLSGTHDDLKHYLPIIAQGVQITYQHEGESKVRLQGYGQTNYIMVNHRLKEKVSYSAKEMELGGQNN